VPKNHGTMQPLPSNGMGLVILNKNTASFIANKRYFVIGEAEE